jgi:transcriptional regulator with XRE-family HTH domain
MNERSDWGTLRERRMTSPEAQEGYHAAQLAAALGDTVRHLRTERGWTQKELGKRARLTQSAVARLEAGDSVPTLRVLERVAHALGAQVDVKLHATEPRDSSKISGGRPLPC